MPPPQEAKAPLPRARPERSAQLNVCGDWGTVLFRQPAPPRPGKGPVERSHRLASQEVTEEQPSQLCAVFPLFRVRRKHRRMFQAQNANCVTPATLHPNERLLRLLDTDMNRTTWGRNLNFLFFFTEMPLNSNKNHRDKLKDCEKEKRLHFGGCRTFLLPRRPRARHMP